MAAGVIDRLEGWADAISRGLAFLAAAALLIVALMVGAEIALRSIADISLVGVADIAGLTVAVAVSAAFPVATTRGTHLVIELLREKFGVRARSGLAYLGGWMLAIALGLLTWRIGVTALDFGARGSTTQVIDLPIAPFLWAVTVFMGMAAGFQVLALCRGPKVPGDIPTPKRSFGRDALPLLFGLGAIAFVAVAVFGRGGPLGWLVPSAPLIAALVFFAVMWVAGLLMFPLAAVLLLSGFAGIAVVLDTGPALSLVATRTIDMLVSDILMIIPLFMLMGSFAQTAGLSNDVYRLAQAVLGSFRGGLALATIGACAGFGAMTGSSIATALTIGSAAHPEMRRHGYSDALSTGSIAAGGTLGQLVPPSAPLVLYAILTESSVGALFIAAAIPAALIVALFVASISIQVRLDPSAAPQVVPRAPGEFWLALRAIWPSAGLIAGVLGGIYTGVFTVTEAASIGALGAFVLALARGRLRDGALSKVMIESAERTAMIYALIIGGSIFAFFIGVTRLPVEATEMLAGLDLPGLAVVAIALVMYILLGMIMEPFSILIITVPVIAPILAGFGYDLIWWGIVMVLVVEIGLLTPPFGINAFIIKAIAPDVPLGRVFRGITPFVVADLVGLALLVLFPALALWLPRLLM